MIIALLGDIVTQFPQNPGVKAKATLPYIEKGILYLQQQGDSESKEQANYTLGAIKKIL